MKFHGIIFSGEFYWNIHKNTPAAHSLESLPRWLFINPLLYNDLSLTEKSMQL